MPDIYSNGNGSIQVPVSVNDTPVPITKLSPIVLPYSATGQQPLSDADLFRNSFTSSIDKVQSEPWVKAEAYTNPLIKTPLSQTYRYNNSDIGYNPLDPDLEQKYAAEQGTGKRFLNRLAKFGATAAVSFLDTIDATMNFVSGNEAVTSQVQTDTNGWLQDLDNFILPNYKTTYQKENPYLSYFTPWNFKSWLDNVGNVGQQLGYTVGAIAATIPLDLALAAVGGEAIDAILLPKQLEKVFAGLGKLSRIAAEGGEEYNAFIQTANGSENVIKGINAALSKATNLKKGVDLTRFFSGVTISAYGESIVEGNNTYTQVKKDLQSQYQDEFGNFNGNKEVEDRIEQSAKAAAKSIVAPNFAFLALSNAIGYSSILKPAQAAIKETEKALASEAKIALDANNINKFTSTPVKGMWNRFTKPTVMIGDNLRESFEEGYQYLLSNTAKNYYERQFNHDSTKDTVSLMDEYSKSIDNLFTTQEGKDNLFLGFLSGYAQHGIKSIYNKIAGNVETPKSMNARILNGLNSVGVTDLFANTRKEAVTSVDLANELTKANEKGDVFQYKNLQHEQLFNFVSSAVNNHKFDARIDQLNALKNLSEENFNFVFGFDANASNRANIDEYVNNVITKAKDIKNDIERINYVFGENPFSKKKDFDNYDAFNNYRTELALSLSKQKDFQKRAGEITTAISDRVPTASVEDIYNLSTEKGILKNVKDYERKIKDLENSEKLAVGNAQLTSGYKKERKFLEDKVVDLRSNLSEFDPDMYIQTLKELYNYHSNLNSLTGNSNVNELDVLSTYNISKDLSKVYDTMQETAFYYTQLSKKNGFDNFKNDFIKLRDRSLEFLAGQVDVDANGKMFFKPTEVAPEAEQAVAPEELQTQIEKLDEATPQEVAAAMNPNYANEPDSEEAKIASGEIELTEEIREAAKERVRSRNEARQQAAPKSTTTPTEGTAPTTETPEQRKTRRSSTQPAVETVAVDYENIVEVPKTTPKTSAEKFWDGLFSPIKMFFKITSLGARKDFKIDYKENLRSALFSTNSKEGVNKLLSSINLDIVESTEGLKAGEFGSYPIQGRIYRKGQKYQVTALAGTKPIGLLNEPDSLYYKEGEEFKPLHEITSPSKYEEVTGNRADTFEQFKKESNTYREGYNKLISKYNGEAVKISNEELQSIFTPVISYGSIEYSKKAEDSTLLKDLAYKGKGSAILSFPMIYNEVTDQYERQLLPNILNKADLSVEDLAAVSDFFEKNPKLAKDNNTRYAYLMKMPDGTFTTQSFLVARSANESSANIDEFFDSLKLSVQEAREGKYTLKSINEVMGNALYISHSKQSDKRRTHIRFSVSKKSGDLALNIFNKQMKVSTILFITEDELNSIENTDAFIDYINNRIRAKEQTNTPLRSLGVSISKENFKKQLANDENVSSDELKETLAASVKQNVFSDFSITLAPPSRNSSKVSSGTKRQSVAADVEEVGGEKKPRKNAAAPNPKIAEVNKNYNIELKPIVEKRIGKPNLTEAEVTSAVNTDDVTALLKYYEEQREAQVGNAQFNGTTNFSANTSFWDKKIKDLREYLKINKKKAPKKANIVSKKQLDAFVDKNQVSEDVLQDIAQKVVDGDKLTPEENAVFIGKTADINEIIRDIKAAEASVIDLTSIGVQEGEALIAMPDLPSSLEKGSPQSKSITVRAPSLSVNFDLEDIIKQLEAKGIVKKDCK